MLVLWGLIQGELVVILLMLQKPIEYYVYGNQRYDPTIPEVIRQWLVRLFATIPPIYFQWNTPPKKSKKKSPKLRIKFELRWCFFWGELNAHCLNILFQEAKTIHIHNSHLREDFIIHSLGFGRQQHASMGHPSGTTYSLHPPSRLTASLTPDKWWERKTIRLPYWVER